MLDETDFERKPSRPRVGAILGALLASLALVAATGCSDSADDPAATGDTGGTAIVTGSAKCDRASMEKAVQDWSDAFGDGEDATLPEGSDSFRCADGWAVAFPDVGPEATAVTVTSVFEAEGQFWIPKDRSKVCGKNAADSEVPKELYRDGCQTN